MCLKPIFLKKIESYVPCGWCPKCKLKRVNAWVFRLQQEEKLHTKSLFVTLTYDNKNIPISQKGFMTLRKTDWQQFVKRLRYNTGDNRGERRIKYYACGEYGSQTVRPHYHAIIFDAFEDQIYDSWGKGQIKCLPVNSNTIAYCCKYICKEQTIGKQRWDDRERERAFMSLGLGKNYITPQTIRYHTEHMDSSVQQEGGYIQCLPRYYRDKIFTPEQRNIINEKNYAAQEKEQQDLINIFGDPISAGVHRKQVLITAVKQNILKNKQRNKI